MNAFHNTTYQIVWGTKHRKKNMLKENRSRLYGYLHAILVTNGCHVIQINGVADHLHIAVSIPPKIAPSKLIQELKQDSSKWIRVNEIFPDWEGWQGGYFLGTYALEARPNLIRYIKRQEIHHGEVPEHAGKTARETEDYLAELRRLLRLSGIPWEEKYLD